MPWSRTGTCRDSARGPSRSGSAGSSTTGCSSTTKSGDTIRAAFALADREPAIARQVEHRRDQLAVQTRQHFAPDIEDLAPAAGDALLACIEALFQFESLELLRAGMGMTQERTREVLVAGLTALLHRPS